MGGSRRKRLRNLPGASGLTLLSRWRADGRQWPVILLTARDAVADRVAGLQGGANDYMVKPFANEELVARIHVQLRQHAPPPAMAVERGDDSDDSEIAEYVEENGEQPDGFFENPEDLILEGGDDEDDE